MEPPPLAPPALPAEDMLSPRMWVAIVWGCYLLTLFTAFASGIIGVMVADIKRDSLPPEYQTHMTAAIKAFWRSLIVSLIALPAIIVVIGFPVLIAINIWFLYRAIKGVIRLSENRPYENPTHWI
jgi:uncharacterized membrane protein